MLLPQRPPHQTTQPGATPSSIQQSSRRPPLPHAALATAHSSGSPPIPSAGAEAAACVDQRTMAVSQDAPPPFRPSVVWTAAGPWAWPGPAPAARFWYISVHGATVRTRRAQQVAPVPNHVHPSQHSAGSQVTHEGWSGPHAAGTLPTSRRPTPPLR